MRLKDCKKSMLVRVVRLDHHGEVPDDRDNLRGTIGRIGRIQSIFHGDIRPITVRFPGEVMFFKPGELQPFNSAFGRRETELVRLRRENEIVRDWLGRWERMHNVMPGKGNAQACRLVPLKEIRMAKMGIVCGKRGKR